MIRFKRNFSAARVTAGFLEQWTECRGSYASCTSESGHPGFDRPGHITLRHMPSADELFDTIERHGVIGPPGLLKLSNLPVKQLDRLYHETFHAIYYAQLERVDAEGLSAKELAQLDGDTSCEPVRHASSGAG